MPAKTRKSQNGQVDQLAGFRMPPVYEWVACERDDVNEGLTQPLEVRVLVNPPRADIIAMTQAFKALEEQAKTGDGDTDIDRQGFDLIADRIVAWNVEALNADDEIVPLPPPAEAGGAVLELLPLRAQTYLLTLVRMAHLGGDTRSKLSKRPAATASTEDAKTPSGPQIVDIPTTATHQNPRKSS